MEHERHITADGSEELCQAGHAEKRAPQSHGVGKKSEGVDNQAGPLKVMDRTPISPDPSRGLQTYQKPSAKARCC